MSKISVVQVGCIFRGGQSVRSVCPECSKNPRHSCHLCYTILQPTPTALVAYVNYIIFPQISETTLDLMNDMPTNKKISKAISKTPCACLNPNSWKIKIVHPMFDLAVDFWSLEKIANRKI